MVFCRGDGLAGRQGSRLESVFTSKEELMDIRCTIAGLGQRYRFALTAAVAGALILIAANLGLAGAEMRLKLTPGDVINLKHHVIIKGEMGARKVNYDLTAHTTLVVVANDEGQVTLYGQTSAKEAHGNRTTGTVYSYVTDERGKVISFPARQGIFSSDVQGLDLSEGAIVPFPLPEKETLQGGVWRVDVPEAQAYCNAKLDKTEGNVATMSMALDGVKEGKFVSHALSTTLRFDVARGLPVSWDSFLKSERSDTKDWLLRKCYTIVSAGNQLDDQESSKVRTAGNAIMRIQSNIDKKDQVAALRELRGLKSGLGGSAWLNGLSNIQSLVENIGGCGATTSPAGEKGTR